MGLDTVELVMAVEEEFNLEIPDTAAERMFAVSDMHSFLVSELTRRDLIAPSAPRFLELPWLQALRIGRHNRDETQVKRELSGLIAFICTVHQQVAVHR